MVQPYKRIIYRDLNKQAITIHVAREKKKKKEIIVPVRMVKVPTTILATIRKRKKSIS